MLSVPILVKLCRDSDGLYIEICIEEKSSGVVDSTNPDILLEKTDIL